MAVRLLILQLALGAAAHGAPSSAWAAGAPSVRTSLGTAVGSYAAEGVERYGGIPYALPPVGARRFARAEVSTAPWPGGVLDARRPGPPCIQNPSGDPRSSVSESGPPSEDCLYLNIWRPPASYPRDEKLKAVMVWLFGGGLCMGFAGNSWYNGSNLVLKHDVIVVTVQYRTGALGFMVGEDASRPGTGGMNGIYDNVVALQWLRDHIGSFGGDPSEVTVFGQSSGGYSTCSLSVAPAARGLLRRAGLLSGPCFGGPPGRGWGPQSLEKGRNVTALIFHSLGARTLDDLRKLPAEQVQWPEAYMNDPDKAPYFSGYFEDPGVLPSTPEDLWRQGAIHPEELIVSFTSKDGTSAYYGTSPTLGLIPPSQNTSTPEGFRSRMRTAWGDKAEAVMQQYPLADFPSIPAAFVQADADAYVICPSRQLARYASLAGRRVWVTEFAHFQPSPSQPQGCSGYGPHGCRGMGCDNGVELDVVPGYHTNATRLWATHGAEYHYIFGTESGPDGLGPPNNITSCAFNPGEAELSQRIMAHWASFARFSDPNIGAVAGSVAWPAVTAAPASSGATPRIQRLRFAEASTDGVASSLLEGVRDRYCDFWDNLFDVTPQADVGSADGLQGDAAAVWT